MVGIQILNVLELSGIQILTVIHNKYLNDWCVIVEVNFFDGHRGNVREKNPSNGIGQTWVNSDQVKLKIEIFFSNDLNFDQSLEMTDDLLTPTSDLRRT